MGGGASIAGNTGAKTIKLEINVSPFFYFIFWCKGGASHGSKRKIPWASRMRGSRGSLSIYNKKTGLTTFFLSNIFYRGPMVYVKENYNFPRFDRGNIDFQGRGIHWLIPYRNLYNL